MKSFKAYVQEANRVCTKVLDERDSTRANQKLIQMQEKIRQSQLTVYQKDFLLQRLRSTNETSYA
jgi:hypothetical protein